jgi:DNA topoisomerase-2
MHVFYENCVIRKVSCAEEIIYRFYNVRKNHYISRKKYLVDTLSSELLLLESKVIFIKLVIEEKIIIFNKKKDFIVKQISLFEQIIKVNGNYDYLLDIKLHSLTEEKIIELNILKQNKFSELEILKATTIESLWNSELDAIKW